MMKIAIYLMDIWKLEQLIPPIPIRYEIAIVLHGLVQDYRYFGSEDSLLTRVWEEGMLGFPYFT